MSLIRRSSNPHALTLGMTAIKMGDRLLQIGCPDGGRLAALAAKVGLSGRACVAATDDADAARARRGAAQAGVLVEVEVAPAGRLPFEDEAFDLIVVDDTREFMAARPAAERAGLLQESLRVLRPGGRVFVIESMPVAGLAGLLRHKPADSEYRRDGGALTALHAGGFRSARLLAEREGLAFVEGMKPRQTE
ncbi:MAG TPA: methyltransferase domain-containing protein [Vicinamibacterales bacterium]|nr:methyltransferase domain-containing protein [Vicinamibacterales bacterium]